MLLIRKRTYARAGLLGNPSDGYNGKTISFIVRNFWAEVVLYEWDTVDIVLAQDDRASFRSVHDLAHDVTLHGYYGGIRLIKATIKRFNGFARAGKDADFQRGERPVELLFNGPTAPKTGKNPTMYPISSSGPFYAALMTGGNLDTKGGPATNVDGQVLDALGRPIPGLYGVGNCVASASARSYWAGGATLGPFMAFAYLAANAADKEPGSAKARRREAVDA